MRARQRPKLKQYWAYYRVYSHSIIQTVQKKLGRLLPSFYNKVREDNYHITIHPQLQFPEQDYELFEYYIRDHFPSKIDISLDSFSFHPSKTEPRVIYIDITSEYLNFRDNQMQLVDKIINSQQGKNLLEPVPPHLTVFAVDDSHRGSNNMVLPSNIDKILDTVNEIEREKFPLTINETELHIEPTQDYPD